MSRQGPRRPASSRTPTSRPRRVAGQGVPREDQAADDRGLDAVDEASPPAPDLVEDVAQPTPVVAEPEEPEEEYEPVEGSALDTSREESTASPGLAALFDSTRATVVLVCVAVVLALAAGGLFTYHQVSDSSPASGKALPAGQISVPSNRPVLITGADAEDAAAAAAKSAQTIVAVSYKSFDQHVTQATALMTDRFATKYRQIEKDLRKDFVAAKTEVQVRVTAQGVVKANRSEAQVLLFLNEYVSKDGKDTTYTPYRALVTVVNTDKGWLVDSIDTK